MRWITQKMRNASSEKTNRKSLQKKHYEVDNPNKKRLIGKNCTKNKL